MNNENLAPGSFQHRRSIAICIDSVLVICHNQKTPSCMTKLTGDSTFHGSSIQCLKNFHPFPHQLVSWSTVDINCTVPSDVISHGGSLGHPPPALPPDS